MATKITAAALALLFALAPWVAFAADLKVGSGGTFKVGSGGILRLGAGGGGGGGGGGSLPVMTAAVSSNGGTSATTVAINTTGASILLACASGGGGASTITDSASNSWTALTGMGGPPGVNCYYKLSPTTSAGHTATCTGSFCAIAFAAFSGITTYSTEVTGGQVSGTSAQAFSAITPLASNSLVVAAIGFDANQSVAIDSGFSTPTCATYTAGQSYGICFAYKVQGAVAVNPIWSYSTTMVASVVLKAFAP